LARIDAFLKLGASQGCSDVHLAVGVPPMLRMQGDLLPIKFRNLAEAELESYVTEILTPTHQEQFRKGHDIDFSYVSEDGARFRVNVFRKDTGVGAVFRTIPSDVPTLDSLNLPAIVRKFCDFHQGMVLVTGSTGTGKSTTLAAMIDHLNQTRRLNIISLEDPIEFVHRSKQSQVIQRELHTHLPSFAEGVRAAMREDPDVILVGELRDVETFEAAVHSAETGHLVFGTIHASSAPTTINRILDLFPPEKHVAIRAALANNLKAIVAQKLLKGLKKPRVPTNEIMIVNPIIRKLIAESRDNQIGDVIRNCYQEGMLDFTENLRQLVERGDTDRATALEFAPDPEKLKMAFKGIKVAASGILS
jgi:twitching motility protein PilT